MRSQWCLCAAVVVCAMIVYGINESLRLPPRFTEQMILDHGGKFVKLRDGRLLEYFEYGSPTGTPMVALHGVTMTGKFFLFMHDYAVKKNVRIIAPSLPGMGFSDHKEGRDTEWVHDVKELVDHLNIDKFALMGVSFGGPHASVTAVELPDRVTRLALVCPVVSFLIPNGLPKALQFIDTRWLHIPYWMGFVNHYIVAPLIALDSLMFIQWMLPAEYQELLAIAKYEIFVDDMPRSYHYSRGHSDGTRMLSELIQFELDKIPEQIKVDIFGGERDTLVPLVHQEFYHRHIPHSELIVFPSTHFLFMKNHEEILDKMFE